MIDDLILNYILLFIILEIYEISWQKAPSIMGMLIRMYKYYSKSIFLFLLMQPTFYFAIGFAMLMGLMLIITYQDIIRIVSGGNLIP